MGITVKGKTILVVMTGVGLVATAWLAAKNSPEAQKRKETALEEKRQKLNDEKAELTFVESVKAQIGAYIPAIISGTVTLGSLIGSEVINSENLKKAEKTFDNFKSMTEKLEGKGAEKTIEKAVEQKKQDEKKGRNWDATETFRIIFQGKCIQFESTRDKVIDALYTVNRLFHTRGCVVFNDLLNSLEQDPVEDGDLRGWESYIGEAYYGYTWIDFGLQECEDEPWVTEIYMPVNPHPIDEKEAEEELDAALASLKCGIPTRVCLTFDDNDKNE